MTNPKIINLDSVINPNTGLGRVDYDSSVSTGFLSRYPINPDDSHLLSRLYRTRWQVQKVCSFYPKEMTKEWGNLLITDNLDLERNINTQLQKLKKIFRDGQTFANLYGGALVIRFIEDGGNLDEPVNYDNIKSIDYSRIYDRWEINTTISREYVSIDPYDSEYYWFWSYVPQGGDNVRTGQKIHKDRILRFRGVTLPPIEQILNNGWEDSVLQTFIDTLKNYLASLGYVTEALRNFEILILKTLDLHDALLMGNKQAIEERSRQIAKEISSMRPVMMDKKAEDAEIINRQFNNVESIVKLAMQEMIASSGIDAGEFYKEKDQIKANSKEERLARSDRIKSLQEEKWGDLIRHEIKLLTAPFQLDETDWRWEWTDTYKETPSEKIENEDKISQTLERYLNMGVLQPDEIRKSVFDNPNSLIALEDTTATEKEKPLIKDAVEKFKVNGEVLPESFYDLSLEELEATEED